MSGATAARTGSTPDMLGIHEAAQHLGVTMRTLRFYEDKGLISPQRVGTTRIYGKRELGRMQLIMRGKRLGFSIREIKEFLDLYDIDPEHVEQVRQLLVKVGQRMAELRRQKRAIEQTMAELGSIEQQAREWLAGPAARPSENGDGRQGSRGG